MDWSTRLILRTLAGGTTLVGDLPEAAVFDREGLTLPVSAASLAMDQKLGHLYEDGLAFLLDSSSRYERLARNVQIHDANGRTVGECDFLFRDLQCGHIVHLELAVKFYLAVRTDAGLTFPGPDARDHYFRKIQRLRERQLTLAMDHQSVLPAACQREQLVVKQLILGCLFDSVDADEQAVPRFSAPALRRGRWVSIDRLADCFSTDTRFEVIPKPLWAVPLEWMESVAFEPWAPTPNLDRCVMLRVPGAFTPYFVTPARYPDHALTGPRRI